jgi:hypothetical protein
MIGVAAACRRRRPAAADVPVGAFKQPWILSKVVSRVGSSIFAAFLFPCGAPAGLPTASVHRASLLVGMATICCERPEESCVFIWARTNFPSLQAPSSPARPARRASIDVAEPEQSRAPGAVLDVDAPARLRGDRNMPVRARGARESAAGGDSVDARAAASLCGSRG